MTSWVALPGAPTSKSKSSAARALPSRKARSCDITAIPVATESATNSTVAHTSSRFCRKSARTIGKGLNIGNLVQAPGSQFHTPVHARQQLGFVRNDDQRGALLACQRHQQLAQLRPVIRVQAGGR